MVEHPPRADRPTGRLGVRPVRERYLGLGGFRAEHEPVQHLLRHWCAPPGAAAVRAAVHYTALVVAELGHGLASVAARKAKHDLVASRARLRQVVRVDRGACKRVESSGDEPGHLLRKAVRALRAARENREVVAIAPLHHLAALDVDAESVYVGDGYGSRLRRCRHPSVKPLVEVVVADGAREVREAELRRKPLGAPLDCIVADEAAEPTQDLLVAAGYRRVADSAYVAAGRVGRHPVYEVVVQHLEVRLGGDPAAPADRQRVAAHRQHERLRGRRNLRADRRQELDEMVFLPGDAFAVGIGDDVHLWQEHAAPPAGIRHGREFRRLPARIGAHIAQAVVPPNAYRLVQACERPRRVGERGVVQARGGRRAFV